MIKEGCENVIFSIVDPFDILLKNNSQNLTFLLDNKNLKWGKYHYE